MKLEIAANTRRAIGLAIRARRMVGRTGAARRKAADNRSAFYESTWRDAADEVGASIEAVATDYFRIRRGSQVTHVHRNYTDLDGPVTLRLAGNRSVSHRLLSSCGLPTVPSLEFSLSNIVAAYKFLSEHKRCVVKPASGTGAGQGVTTNVTTVSRLRYAVFVAAGFGGELTIERQVEGDNLRLLYLDGELLDAVRRGPPQVTGDGRTSIKQLVHQLNRQRLDGGFNVAQTLLPIDLEMQWTLAEQGLNLRSAPSAGERIQLKSVVNDNMKTENDDVTGQIHESVVEFGRLAAGAINGRFVGVDLIVTELSQPIGNGVILEVNTTPGFYYHYHRSAPANRIAIPVLERCLESSQRSHCEPNEPRTRVCQLR